MRLEPVPIVGGSGGLGGAMGEEPLYAHLPCDVAAIVHDRCVKCHGGGLDNEPLLRNFSEVHVEADAVIDVISDDFMPYRQDPLTTEQKAVLREWVELGAAPLVTPASHRCESSAR